MLIVLCAALLVAEPAASPAPPGDAPVAPIDPADSPPPRGDVPTAPVEPARFELPHYGTPADATVSRGASLPARYVSTLGGGLLAAATTTGALAVIGASGCKPDDCLAVGGAVLALGLLLNTVTAWGFHHLADGKSSARWVLLGSFVGGLIATGAIYGVWSAGSRGQTQAPLWLYGVVAGSSAAVSAGVTSELGNAWAIARPETEDDKKRWWWH